MHGRRQVPRRSPSLQDSIIFKRHEEPRLPVSFIYLGRELKTTSAAEAPPPAPPIPDWFVCVCAPVVRVNQVTSRLNTNTRQSKAAAGGRPRLRLQLSCT